MPWVQLRCEYHSRVRVPALPKEETMKVSDKKQERVREYVRSNGGSVRLDEIRLIFKVDRMMATLIVGTYINYEPRAWGEEPYLVLHEGVRFNAAPRKVGAPLIPHAVTHGLGRMAI
jgi:hypothetical protein